MRTARARFSGTTSFLGITLAGIARFRSAVFEGEVSFDARFGGHALFNGAEFGGQAGFHEAVFGRTAQFNGSGSAVPPTLPRRRSAPLRCST